MKRLRAFARIVTGLLKELSDESAYQRHLSAHGREHSGPAGVNAVLGRGEPPEGHVGGSGGRQVAEVGEE